MTQGEIIGISIGFLVDVVIIALVILKFRWSNKHFKITQIEFEDSVLVQSRNQAESDVTQLRMKKAEFLLMPLAERKKREWKKAMKEIKDRLKQYKESRTPGIENKRKELKERKKKLEDCNK
jgi:7,8-dihydro-6-hydroxymethylpterin-pyrophosphokinase